MAVRLSFLMDKEVTWQKPGEASHLAHVFPHSLSKLHSRDLPLHNNMQMGPCTSLLLPPTVSTAACPVQSSPVPALYHDIQPSATQHHLGHWCPGTMFLQQPPRLELMLLFFGENKFPCVQHLPSLLKHRLRHLHPMTRVSGFESWLSYKL